MNYDIFQLQLEEFITQIEFGGYQMPFNSDSGFHTALARLPRNMPMRDLADIETYLTRLAAIGAYALSSSLLDVWIALIFGVIGFLARRHGFAVAPIAVGLILGEMVETNFQNSLKMFEGDWWLIFTQPLAALFLVLAFLGLFGPVIFSRIVGRRD